MKRSVRENIRGWGVMAPILIYFCLFTVVPIFYVFYLAFTDYGEVMVNGQFVANFVGFKNFKNVFAIPSYMQSIGISLLITILVTGIGVVLGLFVALLLKNVSMAKGAFRVLIYIPGLLSGAILSQFVNILIGENGGGVINKVIMSTGNDPIIWKDSVFWMYFWIISLVCYSGTGGTAILLLAGLNGIDKSIYEAAKIDGANASNLLFKITMPLMRPMIGFVLINGFIGAFNLFEPIMLISEGGPGNATKVVLFRIYDEAFINFKYGFTSALSIVVMVIVMIFTLINIKFTDNSIYKID